ncbi:MAG TPA: hypothetical protein PLD23_18790 [Armatimonadota bacterium]|nr:hypothetical protein [Armatimonadota bacterium]
MLGAFETPRDRPRLPAAPETGRERDGRLGSDPVAPGSGRLEPLEHHLLTVLAERHVCVRGGQNPLARFRLGRDR